MGETIISYRILARKVRKSGRLEMETIGYKKVRLQDLVCFSLPRDRALFLGRIFASLISFVYSV